MLSGANRTGLLVFLSHLPETNPFCELLAQAGLPDLANGPP
jgi:hypothetical protein